MFLEKVRFYNVSFPTAAHFDYQYGFRKFDGSDGSRAQKYTSNITYYFDNISSTELYSVDQELLKDYIKRQMYVSCSRSI